MTGSDLLVIIGLPAIALAAGLLFGVIIPRSRRRHRGELPIVIAPFHFSEDIPARPPRPSPRPFPASNPLQPPYAEPSAPGQMPFAGAPPFSAPSASALAPYGLPQGPAQVPPAQAPGAAPPRDAQTVQPAWRDLATGTDGLSHLEPRSPAEHTGLRLEPTAETRTPRKPQRAVDGTLQFLPGRMEIVEGRDVGQEIRFVRQPGAAQTEVTFGRGEGAPYRHVQLHEPTVSRLHAKVTLEDKRWRLTNLSRTNPVVVNGTPLEGEGSSHLLSDGDRVEMGEVALRFRAK
jgi:hypothetical protein